MLASAHRFAFRILMCFVLPVAVTLAFYAWQQARLRRPVAVAAADIRPLPADVRLSVESLPAPDRKRYRVSGWVAREAGGQRQLMRPTLLVVAPDGHGTEFRVNQRRKGEPPPRGDHGRFDGFDGFEVELKARQLPADRPLRLVLAVQRDGRRELLDTGTVLKEAQP